jgi:hypothetical protein
MVLSPEKRKLWLSARSLTGLEFGCWTVLGPADPNKTTNWICQCKCGFRIGMNRKTIRCRRFYKVTIGCRECIHAVQLGKGNVKSTEEDRREVASRRGRLGGHLGGTRKWQKYRHKGDRMESNRRMNEARLALWREKAARGQTKGQRSKWSQRFRNEVEVRKLELEAEKNNNANIRKTA